MSNKPPKYRLAVVVIGWVAIAAGLLFQSFWINSAFVRPHVLLNEVTGKSYWLGVTTSFEDKNTLRGGALTWRLRLSPQYQADIQEPCTESPIPLHAPVKTFEVFPAGSLWCPKWSFKRPSGNSGVSILQRDNELQITEWFD
jgi:hypothetical protein